MMGFHYISFVQVNENYALSCDNLVVNCFAFYALYIYTAGMFSFSEVFNFTTSAIEIKY